MLNTVTPWNMVAEGYAESSVKLFPGYAKKALEITGVDRKSTILDVACGPGTLALLSASLNQWSVYLEKK